MSRQLSAFEVISGTYFIHRDIPSQVFRVSEKNGIPVIKNVESNAVYAVIEIKRPDSFIVSRYIFNKKFYNLVLFCDLFKP